MTRTCRRPYHQTTRARTTTRVDGRRSRRARRSRSGDDDGDESFFGAKVEACWQGGADWYPGTVVGVTEDGYDVARDDGDREVVSPDLVRERFEVSAATDAMRPETRARVFSLFDREDDRQDWWCGTVVDSADYYGQGQELHIVFDDGSDHRLWARDVARAVARLDPRDDAQGRSAECEGRALIESRPPTASWPPGGGD